MNTKCFITGKCEKCFILKGRLIGIFTLVLTIEISL